MGKVNIEGSYLVNFGKEQVTKLLSNMQTISKCLQGLEEIKELNESKLVSKIKINEGLVRGIFNLEARLNKNLEAFLINFKLSGTLGRAEGVINLQINESEVDKTLINYKAELEIKGLGATLAKRQISEIAEKIIKEIFDCFSKIS